MNQRALARVSNDEESSTASRFGVVSAGDDFDGNEQTSEARHELLAMARRKTGTIPPEILVAHVERITNAGTWDLQRGALEAVLKRIDAAKREELTPVKGRGAKSLLGTYVTRRGRQSRPYTTLLRSVLPLDASCSCADFRRNSLGLCKHVLAVLAHLTRSPDVFVRASHEDVGHPTLRWDPVRPLTGLGDWLERIEVDPSVDDRRLDTLTRYVRNNGRLAIPPESKLLRRHALVSELERFINARDGAHPRSEPALGPLVTTELERLTRLLEGDKLAKKAQRHLSTLKRKLYPYQRDGVLGFLRAGRLLLADDMGLGKTAQAIASTHALFAVGAAKRALIVVPASLKSQWQREWGDWSALPTTVVEGTSTQRRALYKATSRGVLIVNYEQVVRDRDALCRWSPDLVVLDEAQRIKNWQTKTAASVKLLTPRWRLVLSGTPLENRLDELASLLDWIDDTALAPSWRLAAWHAVRSDGRREVTGLRDLAALRARVAPHMLRRLRKNLLTQLPARTDTRIPVDLTEAQTSEHVELDLPIAKLVAASKRRPLTQSEFLRLMSCLTKQRMICNGLALTNFEAMWPKLATESQPNEALLQSLATPKLRELLEIVQRIAIDQERRIVVLSQWRRMLEIAHWALKPMLAIAGAKAVFFSGEESLARRTSNIVAFHDDPDTRVLLATDAGGVGLNLQRAASCVVNLEMPWNPAVLEQRIGRVHRNGQTEPVEVYNLVSTSGIESRIVDIVNDKRALFRGMFEETADTVSFEGATSFMSMVEKVVDVDASRNEEALTATQIFDAESDDDAVAQADRGSPNETLVLSEPESAKPGITHRETELHDPDAIAVDSVELTNVVPMLARVLERLDIVPTPDGGLTLNAPPEIANALGSLLSRLGQHLSSRGASRAIEPTFPS